MTRVAIIGTGFGGLAAAVRLKQAGIPDLVLFEKSDDVGGVWRENTYPGAACDVPSHLYSLSFAPKADWSRRFAPQAEIHQYLRDVARDFDVLRHIRFGTEVTAAAFDEDAGVWRLTLAGGDEHEADVLIAATGQLSRPSTPAIPGLDRFEGTLFHSARWDHDHDLTGERVAVLGTGASAVQFVPEVRKDAVHVTVFQRSAPYVVPKPDRAYTRAHLRAFRALPATQRFGRGLTRALSERFNRALTEQTRFTALVALAFRLHLRHQVKDPALRRRLVPDYPIGCKRVLFSNDWYPALAQPDVEVVTDPIHEITPRGVRTLVDGRPVDHEVDVVIHGTGFAATEFLRPMTVAGRGGLDLHDYWADGAHAYLGVTVPHFPNMFIVYGPNTNLGGSSVISMIECQTGYLAQAVSLLARGALDVVEVREDVSTRFDHEVQDRLAHSVWATGCASWYQTDSGRVTTNWPGTVHEYRQRTQQFQPADYRTRATTPPR